MLAKKTNHSNIEKLTALTTSATSASLSSNGSNILRTLYPSNTPLIQNITPIVVTTIKKSDIEHEKISLSLFNTFDFVYGDAMRHIVKRKLLRPKVYNTKKQRLNAAQKSVAFITHERPIINEEDDVSDNINDNDDAYGHESKYDGHENSSENENEEGKDMETRAAIIRNQALSQQTHTQHKKIQQKMEIKGQDKAPRVPRVLGTRLTSKLPKSTRLPKSLKSSKSPKSSQKMQSQRLSKLKKDEYNSDPESDDSDTYFDSDEDDSDSNGDGNSSNDDRNNSGDINQDDDSEYGNETDVDTDLDTNVELNTYDKITTQKLNKIRNKSEAESEAKAESKLSHLKQKTKASNLDIYADNLHRDENDGDRKGEGDTDGGEDSEENENEEDSIFSQNMTAKMKPLNTSITKSGSPITKHIPSDSDSRIHNTNISTKLDQLSNDKLKSISKSALEQFELYKQNLQILQNAKLKQQQSQSHQLQRKVGGINENKKSNPVDLNDFDITDTESESESESETPSETDSDIEDDDMDDDDDDVDIMNHFNAMEKQLLKQKPTSTSSSSSMQSTSSSTPTTIATTLVQATLSVVESVPTISRQTSISTPKQSKATAKSGSSSVMKATRASKAQKIQKASKNASAREQKPSTPKQYEKEMRRINEEPVFFYSYSQVGEKTEVTDSSHSNFSSQILRSSQTELSVSSNQSRDGINPSKPQNKLPIIPLSKSISEDQSSRPLQSRTISTTESSFSSSASPLSNLEPQSAFKAILTFEDRNAVHPRKRILSDVILDEDETEHGHGHDHECEYDDPSNGYVDEHASKANNKAKKVKHDTTTHVPRISLRQQELKKKDRVKQSQKKHEPMKKKRKLLGNSSGDDSSDKHNESDY